MDPKLSVWSAPPSMDTGVPTPICRTTERGFYCAYLLSDRESGRVAVLRFDTVLYLCFGYPNDEALSGHPLWRYGLSNYAFYQVEHSPLIKKMEEQNSGHRMHRPGIYSSFNHWIATFHDETLEVVAQSASVAGISLLTQDEAIEELLKERSNR